MSSIKVGDFVEVVKPIPCCGNAHSVGFRFVVSEVRFQDVGRYCVHCDVVLPPASVAHGAYFDHHYAVTRLKKLPPLVEPETETTEEEIRA